jgi:hypothetical protein
MPVGRGLPGNFGNYSADEQAMGALWHKYWAGFAETGVMGVPDGGIAWPAYDASNRATMEIKTVGDGGLRVITGLRDVTCNWWDNYGYKIY